MNRQSKVCFTYTHQNYIENKLTLDSLEEDPPLASPPFFTKAVSLKTSYSGRGVTFSFAASETEVEKLVSTIDGKERWDVAQSKQATVTRQKYSQKNC